MPKIAQYQPDQTRTQVVAQPLAKDAPAGAFGSAVAKGVLDVAQAGIDIKTRIDTTSAEESLVKFERDKNNILFNPDNGYFNTQGRDAYDNSTAATASIEDLKKSYGEKLGANAKLMFDNAASKHITRSQLDIARHASKGLKAWEVSTLDSQVENTIENASLYWNDEQSLKVQNVLGRQAIFDSAKMMGLGFEATAEKIQTYESAFARSTIEAATQSSSVEGKKALDDYGKKLEGPDKVKMESLIEKKTKVEKTHSDARMSVLTATRLVDQYEDRNDIIKEVNKIKDADLRKKTMTETMSQFSRKKQAESEFRASSFEDAEDVIMKGGSAEQYKVNDPEGWESLSPKQQRSIDSGIVAVTDWNAFSDLMLLPKKELAKVDPTDHFDKLAKTERSRLISAVKSAGGKGSAKDKVDHQVGRTRSAQTTAAVEQLFGKKSKWTKTKREQVNAFYALLDGEEQSRKSQLDRDLSSEEFTNLLAGLTSTVVQEGTIWDTELDLTDIPSDDVPVLSKFLRDNNVPVTADNLIKAHKQASK